MSLSHQLLVVHDEAQALGDRYHRFFKSRGTDCDTDRPLLSPIMHGFRMVGSLRLFQVIAGTGLSIYKLDWIRSSGAVYTGGHTYLEFPGWTDRQSVESYLAGLRRSLPDEDARQALDTLFPPKAIDMMIQRLIGRYHPLVSAMEKIIELGMSDAWQVAIVETETGLTSWSFNHLPGNLQYELLRLEHKYRGNLVMFKDLQSVEGILGLFLFQRYMFGGNELVLPSVFSVLVELAFGRIKMIDGVPRVVLDESFVLKAVESYFKIKDSSFMKTLLDWVLRCDKARTHGYAWELMMANVLPETFKSRPLYKWSHVPSIMSLSKRLEGPTEVVGLHEHSLERGITHNHISMEEFMDAHANNNSFRDDGRSVPPFFFPQAKPSGPDIIFFIQVKKNLCNKYVVPVFFQLKLRQIMSTPDSLGALESVYTKAVKKHVKNFYEYCPANVYVSMIVAYPTRLTGLSPRPDLELETIKARLATLRPRSSQDPEGNDLEQVVIRVDETNFEAIFPKSHVEFLKGIETPVKRPK
ncbi:hypothetical protein BGZ83_000396 [Gryganskiella cystojenkinii]|nr:hypothetical protein BGZ83_000396 [Gryganskiella cystojenkinii]